MFQSWAMWTSVIVDRGVAVRMVTLHRFADDAGTLAGRAGRSQTQVVHRHQDAPLRRLEPIAHVGQGPADDDAHGVGEIAVLELILDVERLVAVAISIGRNGRVRGRTRRREFIRQSRNPLQSSLSAGTWPA